MSNALKAFLMNPTGGLLQGAEFMNLLNSRRVREQQLAIAAQNADTSSRNTDLDYAKYQDPYSPDKLNAQSNTQRLQLERERYNNEPQRFQLEQNVRALMGDAGTEGIGVDANDRTAALAAVQRAHARKAKLAGAETAAREAAQNQGYIANTPNVLDRELQSTALKNQADLSQRMTLRHLGLDSGSAMTETARKIALIHIQGMVGQGRLTHPQAQALIQQLQLDVPRSSTGGAADRQPQRSDDDVLNDILKGL